MISIPDPDEPDRMPVYEGLDPAAVLVDGSYPAVLSIRHIEGPLLVETDGPFAQKDRRPLRPWEVTDAIDGLADLWGTTRQRTAQAVRANETALLTP